MLSCLDQLNQYSSLILVAVTILYVVLTWRMVREMRAAREEESKPHLIATLVPLGSRHVKLRIQNAGRGPALDIIAKWWLEPNGDTQPTHWLHPVLLAGGFEDFASLGGSYELDKLASEHDKLDVDLHWRTIFKRDGKARYEIDLKRQKEAWYNADNLLPPDDIQTQLGRIKEELSKIRSHLESPDRQRSMNELREYDRRKKSWWRKLRKRIAQYAHGLLQTKHT